MMTTIEEAMMPKNHTNKLLQITCLADYNQCQNVYTCIVLNMLHLEKKGSTTFIYFEVRRAVKQFVVTS